MSNIFSFWGESRGGGQYREVPSCSLATPPPLNTPLHSLSRHQRNQLDTRLDLLQKQLNRYDWLNVWVCVSVCVLVRVHVCVGLAVAALLCFVLYQTVVEERQC